MLYIFSSILLFVFAMLIPKTKETLNGIKTITIQFVVSLAYHTLVCYIFNKMNIPITLTNLSMVNLLITAILIYTIIEKKQIQSYQIKKQDVIITMVLFLVVIVTMAINFRGLSRIRYISMDSFVHYKAAREFSENTTLFDKAIENTTTSKCFMPMGYVNVGILFKLARPYIGTISLYRIYIVFEAFCYFLVGMVFYFCLQTKIKKKNQYGIAIVCSIFYLIGYPLNALVSGFHYLILGILYATAIFDMFVHTIEKRNIQGSMLLVVVSLLNIGLIFSYSLFCPAIYLAEFVYWITKHQEDKKKRVLFIVCSLLITGLMGADISLYQRIHELGNVGIELDGWIYQNPFSNIIVLLPFAIFYFWMIRKDKTKKFEKNMTIFFVIFVCLLLLGTKVKLCSNYYYYKTYYILWFLILYMHTSGMMLFLEGKQKRNHIVTIYLVGYLFMFSMFLLLVDTPIQVEKETKQRNTNIMEIYTFNKTNMAIETPFVSKEEIELFTKLEECIQGEWKKESSILMLANTTQEKWLQALTGYYHTIYPNGIEDVKKWNEGKYEYLLILEKRNSYEVIKPKINLEKAEIIVQNEGGTLYKRKSGEES